MTEILSRKINLILADTTDISRVADTDMAVTDIQFADKVISVLLSAKYIG